MHDTKEERELLINKKNIPIGKRNGNGDGPFSKWSLYIVVVFFNAMLQMSNLTVSQFIYHWLAKHSKNDTVSLKNKIANETVCNSNTSSNENILQKEASEWLWYLKITESGISLFVITFLGIYSDFIGRKPLLLICTLGNTLKNALITAIIYFDLDIFYLFIAYSICGLGGSYYTFHIGFLASVADRTKTNNDRTFGMAVFELLIGMGASGSQIGSGYLIQLLGFLYPVLVCSGFGLMCLLVVLICVSETNKAKGSETFSAKAAFQNFTGFYRNSSYIKGNPVWKFVFCILGIIFAISPYSSAEDILTLFFLRSPFCLLAETIGWIMSASSFIELVIGTSLIKVFHLCIKDEGIALLGCLSGMAYFLVLAFSKERFMLYIAIGVGLFSVLPFPMFRALASKMVDKNRQGALFANLLVLEVVCKLASSTGYNNLYAQTQGIMAGLTFIVMGGVTFLAVLVTISLVISGVKKEFEYSQDVS